MCRSCIGCQKSIILDREPQFIAGLMKKLNKMLDIEIKLSTAFHLLTDRKTERTNQELEQYLRIYIDSDKKHGQNSLLWQILHSKFICPQKYHHLL